MPDTLAGFAEGICVWSTGASRPGYNEPKLVVSVKFSKRGFVVWRFGGFRRFMGRV